MCVCVCACLCSEVEGGLIISFKFFELFFWLFSCSSFGFTRFRSILNRLSCLILPHLISKLSFLRLNGTY